MINRLSNFRGYLTNAWQGLKLVPKLRPSQIPAILESFTKKDFLLLGVLMIFMITSGGFLFASSFGSSGNEPDYGGEHIEGLVGQPRFINPVLAASSSVDTDLSRIIYAQLIKFDKDLNLVPDLAETMPEVSADQKTYTVKLKPNLKWQDGKPLTADDVLFTIQTIQNGDFESPLRANWSRVKAEKIDDLTLTFTLREVSASFITNFTLGIAPKHVWSNLTPNNFRLSDKNLQPIGSGPFIVREIKKTADGTIKSITLKSNEYYHEGRPYLDRVTFKFYLDYDSLITGYQGREVDAIGYLPFDKKAFLDPAGKHNQLQINLPQYQAAFFNLPKNPILADKAVRQALWLSTDRQQIVDEVYMGAAKQAYGPILEGNLGYNPEIAAATHTSIDEAKQILDKGGWVIDPNTGIRSKNKRALEINLATNNFVLNVKTAQLLQSQWSRIGAQVNLVIVSAADLEQQYIRSRNFDVLLFSENTGADPDPFPFWHSSQVRDPGLNLSGFSNAEADRLLTAARQTNDVNVRIQNYQQFQRIVADQIPAVFLSSAVYVYNIPHKLQGVDLETMIHPSERFVDINNWFIETK
jgi:peptide/nickel transport system substrate-binding protein